MNQTNACCASCMVQLVMGDGFRTIGPSRFGYYGSSLPEGATPETQADAYVELLDHLGIDRAIVVGYSAGGPSAIALALHHPDRVQFLILAASYLPRSGQLPRAVQGGHLFLGSTQELHEATRQFVAA